MPLQSKAQRRFLWAKHPAIARKFEDHTPKGTVLPERVEKHAIDQSLLLAARAQLHQEKLAANLVSAPQAGPPPAAQPPMQGTANPNGMPGVWNGSWYNRMADSMLQAFPRPNGTVTNTNPADQTFRSLPIPPTPSKTHMAIGGAVNRIGAGMVDGPHKIKIPDMSRMMSSTALS